MVDAIRPREPEPAGRRDFDLRVNRRLEYEVGAPLVLYWEVYGLTPDDEGHADYEVSVQVTAPAGEGVLTRIVRTLGELLGPPDAPDGRLRYRRTVRVVGDRVPEYLQLQLGAHGPGEYAVRVRVVDRRTGRGAERAREFEVIER